MTLAQLNNDLHKTNAMLSSRKAQLIERYAVGNKFFT